jgi:hypothetical protein
MFEQKRLGDNGTSAATSKASGDRGDEMDEKDGQVAHLAIVPISTSVTRLGTRWDLCDKSGIRHRQIKGEQLRRRERLVDVDSQCRQLVVDTFHVHVERHRLDRILLMHDTAPISPLRIQLHTAESARLKGGDRRNGKSMRISDAGMAVILS